MLKKDIDLERAVKLLLTNTDSIDMRYKDGSTLLMRAITFNNFEFAKLFLDYGANPDACNNDQMTALMYAANSGDPAIIDYLISKGALVNACDRFNKTSLIYAVEVLNEPAAKLLVAKGADVNDVSCIVTLMTAARTADLHTLKLLLDLGIRPNICSKGGTELINAVQARSSPTIKFGAVLDN